MFVLFSQNSSRLSHTLEMLFTRGSVDHVHFGNTSIDYQADGWLMHSEQYRMITSFVVSNMENLTFISERALPLPRVCATQGDHVYCSEVYQQSCPYGVYVPSCFENRSGTYLLLFLGTFLFLVALCLVLAFVGRVRDRLVAWMCALTTAACVLITHVRLFLGGPAQLCMRTADSIVLYVVPLTAWGLSLSIGRLISIASHRINAQNVNGEAARGHVLPLVYLKLHRTLYNIQRSYTCWLLIYLLYAVGAAQIVAYGVHMKALVAGCAFAVLALSTIVYGLEVGLAYTLQDRRGNPLLLVILAVFLSSMGFAYDQRATPLYGTLAGCTPFIYCFYLALSTQPHVHRRCSTDTGFILDAEWFKRLARYTNRVELLETHALVEICRGATDGVERQLVLFRIWKYTYGYLGWHSGWSISAPTWMSLSESDPVRLQEETRFLRDTEKLLIKEAHELGRYVPKEIHGGS